MNFKEHYCMVVSKFLRWWWMQKLPEAEKFLRWILRNTTAWLFLNFYDDDECKNYLRLRLTQKNTMLIQKDCFTFTPADHLYRWKLGVDSISHFLRSLLLLTLGVWDFRFFIYMSIQLTLTCSRSAMLATKQGVKFV